MYMQTQDFHQNFPPDTREYVKSFMFRQNNFLPLYIWLQSRVWTVDNFGINCQQLGDAACYDPSPASTSTGYQGCTGPGSDVWVGWLPGVYTFGWVSTRHSWDYDVFAPNPFDYTAYGTNTYANQHYFSGEVTDPDGSTCPRLVYSWP